jgi:S1-C subfamily serine protease
MDIIDRIKPAIVAILLINEGQNVQNAKPNGTGFFVTSDGYILTCYHVVEPLIASKAPIQVKTANGIFEADYLADKSRSEKYLDWAVLKVKEKGKFPCLRLFSECKQGDEWCTIGYELAERANGVPNMGKIIGAFDRTESASRDIDLKSANPIRGGVSGSPLFNKKTYVFSWIV